MQKRASRKAGRGGEALLTGLVRCGRCGRMMRVFYDTGAVWDRGGRVEARQSVGTGLEGNLGIFGHNEFLLALAFPLDQGHLEPMFVAGMNF